MGLLQCACETYDKHAQYIGQYDEGKEPLAPIAHIVTAAQLEIVINGNGEFIQALTVDKREPKIIIPVTEESAGRTSAPIAHPLCEQIQYLTNAFPEKYSLYVDQLEEWAASDYSHPMVRAVLKYVRQGTIIDDLVKEGCIQLKEDGTPKDPKLMVRWRIDGIGDESGGCWKNRHLFECYSSYALERHKEEKKGFCMVTGEVLPVASQHPKGIVPLFGNAKLISANDSSGFTYRGRFSEEWQAETVSYEASQKAHAALKWLAANQGIYMGGRMFLCWSPDGVELPNPTASIAARRYGQTFDAIVNASDFRSMLSDTLSGWKASLPDASSKAVIAVFDAATTGRLSVAYFRELAASDFEERLYDWDLHCAWFNGKFGIRSPSLLDIVNCAYGTEKTEKNVERISADDRVIRQQMQNLLSCRVDKRKIPIDLKNYLVERASSPQKYHNNSNYLKVLHVACAVICKYRYDYYREEISMALEANNKDRSYQFGRLLAVMEKIERDTFGKDETREPNAIRLQSVFCQRPLLISNQLQSVMDRAYLPRIKPEARSYYRKLLGEIINVISENDPAEINKPLTEMYLIGYYLQRNALYTKKEEK